jgi:carbonic anhydrase/acetyltransferase-like protein (isoleucine patch superfamily)
MPEQFCSITHHAILHGCVIEDRCLVGINATSDTASNKPPFDD